MVYPKPRGFTLIELLIVIGILSILSVVVIFTLKNPAQKARDFQKIRDLQRIQAALLAYYNDHGQFPNNSDGAPLYGNWDCSKIGTFISPLTQEGYLRSIPQYPGPNPCGYRYYRYNPLDSDNACSSYVYRLLAPMELKENADMNGMPCMSGSTKLWYATSSDKLMYGIGGVE